MVSKYKNNFSVARSGKVVFLEYVHIVKVIVKVISTNDTIRKGYLIEMHPEIVITM